MSTHVATTSWLGQEAAEWRERERERERETHTGAMFDESLAMLSISDNTRPMYCSKR